MDEKLNNVTKVVSNLSSTVGPYEKPFDVTGIAISAAIIFTFLVIGVLGNVLTIAVIATNQELSSNVFMRFIFSLCFSDLISSLISWLFLYRRTWGFDSWSPVPNILCKFYWSADIMTSFVTAFHILSFAALRLISIQFPHTYTKINKFHQKLWIGSIWFACFVCGFLPIWFMFGVGNLDRSGRNSHNARWPVCTLLTDKIRNFRIFQIFAYPLFLFVPTIGIAIICCSIIWLVRKRSKDNVASKKEKQHTKERQAVVQLTLIILSFLLGYLPFIAYQFWAIQDYPNTKYYHLVDYWFGMVQYFFLRFSECLNPLFYNLGSAKMRKHTSKFLKKSFCCRE